VSDRGAVLIANDAPAASGAATEKRVKTLLEEGARERSEVERMSMTLAERIAAGLVPERHQ
jgi:hypothetical protein